MIAWPFRKAQKNVNPKGYWANVERRREFFCKFAEEMGFDPYKPENWQKITKYQLSEKGV